MVQSAYATATTESFAQYFSVARSEMLPFIPTEARQFLELGCGAGEFAAAVKFTRSCQYVGVEMVPRAASLARDVLDDVYVADIERDTPPFRKGQFDCLICHDVLEHLRDPWEVLRKYKYFLRPGGHVVASLPNVRYYDVIRDLILHKRWEYQEWGVLDRTHLRFFTKMTMRKMFIACGYDVLRLEGINGKPMTLPMKILNELTRGYIDDMRFIQFAVVARNA
jgi:SAM-dependent methyltransferase